MPQNAYLDMHNCSIPFNVFSCCVVLSIIAGTKLTYLPFIMKALSITLNEYPGLNVSLEPGSQALLQHHNHNIGVAMATSNGLVVPNVQQVGGLQTLCCLLVSTCHSAVGSSQSDVMIATNAVM